MVEVAQERLSEHAEYVNSLNVFPVPDGDTGTNMNLSFTSGAERVSYSETDRVDQMSKDLAKGLLMGARGNSGVILSQLFRGFSKAMEDREVLNAQEFAQAFSQGVETAYKAVMKPVEGTILTVARESAAAGVEAANETDDIIDIMKTVVDAGKVSLDNTPNLLAVLKEVGVVDSGGQGLLYIYQGFLESLTGEKVAMSTSTVKKAEVTDIAHQENFSNIAHAVSNEDIKFGYCTEIMVNLGEGETVTDTFDYDTFRNHLNEVGDSLLVVADDEIVKVHVHTEYPGEVMNYGQKFGSLIKIKVDNMRMQHDEVSVKGATSQPAEVKPYAVIAVAAGEGVHNLFKSLGVSSIINGGQTMNPSTEDIMKAIDEANAEKTIILPNNKNIFMAADQAAAVSDKDVVVVPSKTILQGLAAMLAFTDQAELEDNKTAMTAELDNVKSGQITTAVRDTAIEGVSIHKDDFMGIIDGKIVVSNPDRSSAVEETLRAMIDEDSEIVTLIYGEDTTAEECEAIAEAMEAEFEDIEFEVQAGNQPVYSYLISVE
ncbi:DAK2 domain-containing protein [Jeotgalibaca arthritidis]|uniref:DAK2 domain-containing protein n=4 Tax=Jeotgalibaca TaxID=1470540 RepID=A0A6G7KD42_9LACT|nr:DAK2 domain-containing protein [Jeotgalibaca arthritidis]